MLHKREVQYSEKVLTTVQTFEVVTLTINCIPLKVSDPKVTKAVMVIGVQSQHR